MADIIIDRIPGGCGLLIPDPYCCGYLLMDTEFSTGLQNALMATRHHAIEQYRDATFGFDWRWRIELLPAIERMSKKPPQIRLSGRSGEVAVACAMIASHPKNPDNDHGIDPLDQSVGVTASFRSPESGDYETLTGVKSVDIKTLVQPMQIKRLLEVVIASDQDPTCVPDDSRFQFPPVSTLGQAYDKMVRHRRLTQGVNRYLAARAGILKRKTCKPYILPAIAERVDRSEFGEAGQQCDPRELSDTEVKQLIKGRLYGTQDDLPADDLGAWIGNRVRIFAHSGMGKSVFILHCQRKIAKSGQDVLPIRLGRTTAEDRELGVIDWSIGNDQIIDKLADSAQIRKAIEYHQPDAGQVSNEQRREWFSWMVKTGRVVFLLDALDQSSKSLQSLGAFLDSASICQCPVIATGRMESEQGQAAFFQGMQWKTLALLPFDESRQRRYLEDLADRLMSDGKWIPDQQERLRKEQSQDLLKVPLLLHLMKELVSSGDDDDLELIQDRTKLYDRAVSHLIRKGWESIERSEWKSVFRGKTLEFAETYVRQWLGKIAWRMMSRHDMSNALSGDAYQSLLNRDDIDADVVSAIQQIDVVTALQLIEQDGHEGLAFRHRSFLEHFCGWYLVLLRSKKPTWKSRKCLMLRMRPEKNCLDKSTSALMIRANGCHTCWLIRRIDPPLGTTRSDLRSVVPVHRYGTLWQSS